MNGIILFNEFESKKNEIKNACDFLPDCSTKEGYDKSKRIALDARRVEKAIDDKRLYLKKEAMEQANYIHSEGKKLCQEINSYYLRHYEAYKSVDDEKKRIEKEVSDKITAQIQEFGDSVIKAHLMSVDEIKIVIEKFNNNKLIFGDRTNLGSDERDSAVDELNKIIELKIENDIKAKEMEVEAESLKAQRDEIMKLKEIQLIENAKKEERERIANKEKELKEKELAIKNDDAHKKLIESAAIECFYALGFSGKDSKRIVSLIADKNIVNVSINY